MSTNMADHASAGDHSNLALNTSASTHSKSCCDSHSHEHSDVKVPTIFDAVKSGFVHVHSSATSNTQRQTGHRPI